ncbi:unnamed protein product [Bemisia tabaci]|uniref:Dolichyldiphosphatase n=1 Tax=Bemisia tabaci TaxID=7038 RepID=A0A9P0ALD9_BEMTA|nr:PREDICTED: dolichyldiphosphatase 1-like [Bemisia tabaci]CAH0394355.1 unnamed protein product [Bemisia tabaci]
MSDSMNNLSDNIADNQPEWVPLSLTLVEYPQGDWLGKCLAMISLLPFAIGSGFVTLILFRKDLHTIVFFFGTLLNEVLNVALKHAICEPRPLLRNVNNLYNEYGMPSSHSQFIWFFASYMAYFIFLRLHLHSRNDSIDPSKEYIGKSVVALGCIVLALVVSYSRIYLQYHTWRQVTYGAFTGIFFGSFWFGIVHIFLTPLFPIVVSWKIAEFLLIRDTTLIPNILWFEYTIIRKESQLRSRKLASMKSQ